MAAMVTRILVVAGSTRGDALSKKLGRAAAKIADLNGGASTFVDLRDYAMPLYDGDLEAAEGLPEGAVRLRQLLLQHEAVLFASPEYNASIPAVLKNAIDWLSRPYAKDPGVVAWKGKVAALLSSSPGALGGLRGLVHLRQILMNVGCVVINDQFALGNAGAAFAPDGHLADAKQSAAVQAVVQRLVHYTQRLAS
jgi:chromate reductase